MSSDRHDQENEKFKENSARKIIPRPCLARRAPGTSIFLFFSAHAFEKKLRKAQDCVAWNPTTENAIYDENMKIVRRKIETRLEKNMSKKTIAHQASSKCDVFIL